MNNKVTLYERVETGKKVSYRPVEVKLAVDAPLVMELTNPELVTLVGSMAMVAIGQTRMLLPEHSRNARKIRAVETAIMELLKGTGGEISEEMGNYMLNCWNRAVMHFQGGLMERLEEERKKKEPA